MAGATLGRRFSNRTMVSVGMLITAGGFALLGSLTPADGYLLLGAALAVMGMGAGLATPAAVTALMSAIPPKDAGAGSAMNSTISQAGSTLGIAVLGSALTAGYHFRLPADLPAARESLAGAIATGDSTIISAARTAFTGSMSSVMLVGAAMATCAAVVAFTLLRPRPGPVAPSPTNLATDQQSAPQAGSGQDRG
jgi:DHA2 family multidrug resistance protein-like MFS transporter